MKLLYATSIVYPSGLANRMQTFAMAKAFAAKLGGEFFLGVNKISAKLEDTEVVQFKSGRSVKIGWRAMQFARWKGVTHIYCREPKLLFAMIFYNKFYFKRDIKFIYEIHTIYDKSLKDRIVEKFVSKNVYCFAYLTSFLKRDHMKKFSYFPQNFVIVPDAVDLKVFDIQISKEQARRLFKIPEDKKALVYTGRFKTMGIEKGLEDVFKALKFLPSDVIFVAMGGKPRDITYYKELAERMDLKNRVFLIEHLNQDMVAVCQKAADILLMPYPDILHYRFYMSPLKMFEYMAAKRPIIATDLPSVREVLSENNAVLIKPENPEDLSKAVKLILGNEKFSSDLSDSAFKEVKSHTWDKRAGRVLEILK